MLKDGSHKPPPIAYATIVTLGVTLSTLPLAHVFSQRATLFAMAISLVVATLIGRPTSLIDVAVFLIAYVLCLTCLATFSGNIRPLREETLVAVMPGVFVAFRPHWALSAFGIAIAIILSIRDTSVVKELTAVFALSAIASIIISFVVRRLLFDATALIRNHRALLARLIGILLLFYSCLTLYFASIYQYILNQTTGAFSYSNPTFSPDFLDIVCYAAMLTTHGATPFMVPVSTPARFATAAHMLITYVFSTVYLATAVNLIANQPGGPHAKL